MWLDSYLALSVRLVQFFCMRKYRLGSVQVLHRQVFPDFGPPCVSIISASYDPPSPQFADVIFWQEVSCLMSYTTCFKLSNILFCIFMRNIFLDIGAVFKNLKALFRKKLINLLIISCILLLALCFNSPTSCIQIVSAFQHFVTNNITKNHRRGVTKRSQRITTTRGGGGCKNVFVWLLKAIIVTLGKAQRFFYNFP